MASKGEWRAALAVVAATAGAGYASGRALVLFFAQLGWAGWPGIGFGGLTFGLIAGGIAREARRTGAGSLAELCRRLLGPRAGAAAGALHALLMALTAGVMLCGASALGALALPTRHGALQGAALALLLALLINMGRLRALPALGAATAASGMALYAALAADPRPVRLYARSQTVLALRGNPFAAALLALFWAALNACAAGGAIVRFAGDARRPAAVGALSGALLAGLLACGNAALARGGEALLSQAMPTVILAARWGLAGFWLSVVFSALCVVSTLAAALGALTDQLLGGRGERRAAVLMLALAAVCAAAFGANAAVGAGYRALGWLCAFAMGALACRLDERRGGPARGRAERLRPRETDRGSARRRIGTPLAK